MRLRASSEPFVHFAKQAILSTAGKIVDWQRFEHREWKQRGKELGEHFTLYSIIEAHAFGSVRFTNVSVS